MQITTNTMTSMMSYYVVTSILNSFLHCFCYIPSTSPRMRIVVHPHNLFKADLCISLRRRQARVPKKLLDVAKIGPAFQQMSRTRVAQHVWMHAVPKTLPFGPNLHPLLNRSPAKPAPTASNKKRRLILRGNSVTMLAPRLQGIVRVPPDRQQSFFAPFASHTGYALFKIHPPPRFTSGQMLYVEL